MQNRTMLIGALKLAVFLLMLLGATGALAAGQDTQKKTKTEQSKQSADDNQSDKININKATADELQKLPRIGPKLSQRIIDFRNQHGGFKKLEELMNVSGIGQKTFNNLKPLIRL